MNAESADSLQVANEWVRLRRIPRTHVLYLEGVPAAPSIDVETFRRKIWQPIRDHLAAAPHGAHVDCIAYSAGFPYSVDFAADLKEAGIDLQAPISPGAALTAMTYLGRRVEKKDPRGYLDLEVNRYFREERPTRREGESAWEESRGFRSRYEWRRRGGPVPDGDPESLDRYWLCVMLAYTGERGTTAAQALDYLSTAAAADGTNPGGTVYLMENSDVRAATRKPFFDSTRQALEALGRKVQVLGPGGDGQDGILPKKCDDVIGLAAGTAAFDWQKCGSRLLPGSIAEHLTSFGAHFAVAGQTKCTEFLKAGAAGTSGAVAEPYAVPHKFPVPYLHVHYARGCSLAEAFYQSVLGPYQLLVLGDPLARPFASFAKVALASPAPKTPWKGKVSIQADVVPASGHPVGVVELWIDGAMAGEAAPGTAIEWDTAAADDGAHEVRLVAVEEGPIATRSSTVVAVRVANRSHPLKVKAPAKPLALGETLRLTGSAAHAKTVQVLQGSRVLAEAPVRMNTWSAEVPAARLGPGSSTLVVRSVPAEGPGVLSDPIEVSVAPSEPEEPRKPEKPTKPKK